MDALRTTVCVLFLLSLWPSSVKDVRFIQIPQLLVISVEKTHPPHIAHEELERIRFSDEWDEMARRSGQRLVAGDDVAPSNLAAGPGDLVVLEAMVVQAPRSKVESDAVVDSEAEITGLDPRQQARVTQALQKHGVLAAEEPGSSWFAEAQKIVDSMNQQKEAASSAVVVRGDQGVERSRPQVEVSPPVGDFEVEGYFKLADGLHFTNNESFEIWRRQEGVYAEQGSIEILQGRYMIRLRGKRGEIVARMRDSRGRVIGESVLTVASIKGHQGKVRGPEIKIAPRTDIAAIPRDMYARKGTGAAEFSSTAFEGGYAMKELPGHEGAVEATDITPGSWTTVRTTADGFFNSLMLAGAGRVLDLPMMPLEMVSTLKGLVSEHLQLNMTDPVTPVIWGQVRFEDRPMAGVSIEVESAPGSFVVYFNELMLPDFSLKSTSSNGTYAVLGAQPGFHALLARRGEGYFAHQNAVLEERGLSVVDFESRLVTESVPVRVFDAFQGAPVSARVLHQAVEEPFDIDRSGSAWIQIPTIKRLSLLHVHPESPYLSATYQADDARGYVHVPLIRGDWLSHVLTSVRADDIPETSIVVGFVPEEDFDVQVADPSGRARVIYFDSAGVPSTQGSVGGGFVIQGLPAGVREVLVFGKNSGEISSRVIASDPRSIQVLTFRAE